MNQLRTLNVEDHESGHPINDKMNIAVPADLSMNYNTNLGDLIWITN